MGTTFCSIHIYSDVPPQGQEGAFRCLSPGWQTWVPSCEDPNDPLQTQKTARRISKRTGAPVLWFYEFDEAVLCMKFYVGGRQVAFWSGDEINRNHLVSRIPELVGYPPNEKRRLSRILKCRDVGLQIRLLEEFLGVCLLPNRELMLRDPQALARQRGSEEFGRILSDK